MDQNLQQMTFDYSQIFMTLPQPNSLVALETNKIIQNERILPGLTKVLKISEDFPQINVLETQEIEEKQFFSYVFVYEGTTEKNTYSNGSLNLIQDLTIHDPPLAENLDAIRREFLKKVFADFILKIPVSEEGDSYNLDLEAITEENFVFGKESQKTKLGDKVIE